MPNEATHIRERFGFTEALKLTKEEAEEFAEGLPPVSKALFETDLAEIADAPPPKPKGRLRKAFAKKK